MNVYEVVSNLTPLAEAAMTFLLFEAFLTRRPERCSSGWLVLGVGILACAFALCNFFFMYHFANIVSMGLVTILFSFLIYRGAFGLRVLVTLSSTLISLALEVVVLSAMMLAFHLTAQEAIFIPEYQFLGILVSKITELAVCNAIRIRKKRLALEATNAYWLMFFFLFSTITLTVFLLFRLLYETHTTTYNTMAVVSALGLFLAAFVALFLYERLARQSQEIRAQAAREQQLKSQVQHLDDILNQQENLRRFRHDFSNLVTAMRAYLDAHDGSSALAYLDRLEARVERTGGQVYSGNTVLDAILSSKQSLAESKGIAFHAQVQISRRLPLSAEALSIIFGNALDNAVEACERVTGQAPAITVTLLQQGEVILCKIVNTTPPRAGGALTTTKADAANHGFGLANLTEALAHYGSTPSIDRSGGTFTLKFILPLAPEK